MGSVTRLEQATQRDRARACLETQCSQREVAQELGVARSSMQDWHRQAERSEAPAALVAFVESGEGV
jgi:transposase-like protein